MSTSRMQAARERRGLSIAYVADHVRRHPASVERWERGRNSPPRACLVALAALYGVDVAELVED